MGNAGRKWAISALVLLGAAATTGAAKQIALKPVTDSAYRRATFTVAITPTHAVPAHTTCTWTANVSGGTAPYSYAWQINNSPIGFDSPTLSYTTGSSGFRIFVTVTDATSAQAVDSKIITLGGSSC